MFAIDDRLRGLPATRDQVVAVHQSINSPHLAVPGKRAGPAQAYIVGLRSGAGFSVYVYLHLGDSGDCAMYVPSRRNLGPEEYQQQENDALGFVESMGFMMDNMNFRGLTPEDQEEMLKALPVFQREPRAPSGEKGPSRPSKSVLLGRLLASF
ncbi:MAG: social motility and stimulation tgl protein [Myxococcales bacterium]|nr:social motility and stimulation tgl protein [Myxococcales bacterium]